MDHNLFGEVALKCPALKKTIAKKFRKNFRSMWQQFFKMVIEHCALVESYFLQKWFKEMTNFGLEEL